VWLFGVQDVEAVTICDVTCRREEDVGRMSKHDVGWTSHLDVGDTLAIRRWLVWFHGAQDVGPTTICDVTCRREEDVGRMSKHDVGWTSELDVGPTVRDS
jgi:4-hydroxy-3-methylbut-2-enyl diphosphate reductase IspH